MKRDLFLQALSNTSVSLDHVSSHSPFHLRLDLFKAQKLQSQRKIDVNATKTLFGQTFHQLMRHRHEEENKYGDLDRDPCRFMVKPGSGMRPWRVVFGGFYADDYGGLFRDSLDRMCRELQSPSLQLLIPCPNAREQIGLNRDVYVPNPAARSPTELSMFTFLGKLMGLAMRTNELLYLQLPSIVWKQLCDDVVTEEDVMAIDALSFRMVHELRKLGRRGLTADMFAEYINATFVVVGSDQQMHELIPGGAQVPVTWHNRYQVVDALISYRKHEFSLQCIAIREG
jgi:hypothetical protein